MLLIFFIVHGFVVNNAVLLCGFKQTKGKRQENSESLDWTAAGIGHSVCVNHLCPVEAGGGGMTKDEALDLALEALTVLLDEWTPARHAQLKGMEAVTAIKQARSAPVQEPEHIDHSNGRYSPLLTRMMNKRVESNVKQVIHLYDEPPATQTELLQESVKKRVESVMELADAYANAMERGPFSRSYHGNIQDTRAALQIAIEKITTPPAQPAPVQEPEHTVRSNGRYSPLLTSMMNKRVESNVKQVIHLYDKPPAAQRQWVGLTDDELIAAIYELEGFAFGLDNGNVSERAVLRYARLVEAKLKEKNT